MNKLYLMAMVGMFVVGAYFYGVNITKAKCETHKFKEQTEFLQQTQYQNLQNKKDINDKVYKTGTGDIRRIMRDKYTIAD